MARIQNGKSVWGYLVRCIPVMLANKNQPPPQNMTPKKNQNVRYFIIRSMFSFFFISQRLPWGALFQRRLRGLVGFNLFLISNCFQRWNGRGRWVRSVFRFLEIDCSGTCFSSLVIHVVPHLLLTLRKRQLPWQYRLPATADDQQQSRLAILLFSSFHEANGCRWALTSDCLFERMRARRHTQVELQRPG